MITKTHNVIIVAHPDDETLFFGGTILSSTQANWNLIVVTDANADGQGEKRKLQLKEACRMLGISKFEQWNLPDIFEQHLDQELMREKLTHYFKASPLPDFIYTHGPVGEYGHPHHQDVSIAVHSFFDNWPSPSRPALLSPAYNSYPDQSLILEQKVFDLKREILMGPYQSEVARFMHLLPCSWAEGLHEIGQEEREIVANCLLKGELNLTPEMLALKAPHYKSYLLHLKSLAENPPERPF